MASSPGLFLFDIDGTILRGSTRVHREAFAHAYATVYGQPSLSLDGISAAGRTDMWLLAEPLRRLGLSTQEIQSHMLEAFAAINAYVERNLEDLRDRVLPGVRDVLTDLHRRGQHLGLLSGSLEPIAVAKMQAAGLPSYFLAGGFGQESEIRDHLVPVALQQAEEVVGHPIPTSRVVVIGDTPMDIQAGAVHGTRTVGVATGPYSEEDLRTAGADLVFPTLEDVATVVRRLLDLLD